MPGLKVCNVPGCPELTRHGRCETHRLEQLRAKPLSPTQHARVRGRRRAAILRPGVLCYWGCGRPATTIDHLHPVAHGGTSHPDNLVPACATCNSSRGATVRRTP